MLILPGKSMRKVYRMLIETEKVFITHQALYCQSCLNKLNQQKNLLFVTLAVVLVILLFRLWNKVFY